MDERRLPRFRSGLLATGQLLAVLGFAVLSCRRSPAPAATSDRPEQRIAAALTGKGNAAAAHEVTAACAGEARSCDCVATAAGYALDLDAVKDARALLDGAVDCVSPLHKGLRAEALARDGDVEKGVVAAATALDQKPDERHALYARALASYRGGDLAEALKRSTAAVAAGRGAPAHVLEGLCQYRLGALDEAKKAFEAASRAAPDSVDALYDLALVAHKQGRYREAREGYLAALARDPKNADARFNLGVLTATEGATGEARHHLDRLKQIVPASDERVVNLERLLAGAKATAPPELRPLEQAPRSGP